MDVYCMHLRELLFVEFIIKVYVYFLKQEAPGAA